MNTYTFRTTIKCSGCVEKVAPFLNELLTPQEWSVDIYTPAKILTVHSDRASAEDIEQKVTQAGFGIERIRE